jgi:hypothetical protein
VDSSQFSSVVIHELGHSLGLDHSCVEAKGSTKFRSCVGLSEDDPYREAVMYPSLRARASLSDQPEIKDLLRPNDSMRASCLYDSRG